MASQQFNVGKKKVILFCSVITITACLIFLNFGRKFLPKMDYKINNREAKKFEFAINKITSTELNSIYHNADDNDLRYFAPTVTPPTQKFNSLIGLQNNFPENINWFRFTPQTNLLSTFNDVIKPKIMQHVPPSSDGGKLFQKANSVLTINSYSTQTVNFAEKTNIIMINSTTRPLFTSSRKWSNPDGEATTNPIYPDIEIILHNPDLCRTATDLEWIIYIHSGANNAKRRQSLRTTWASGQLFKRPITKVAFMIGVSSNPRSFESLIQEFKEHSDLVVGNFIDTYNNLTLKSIMALKWISTYCTNAKQAIKADDDVFVNIIEVMTLIRKQSQQKRLITCPIFQKNTMPILRDPKSCMKWCAVPSEFPGDKTYPRYCSGTAYTLSVDIIGDLYQAALQTRYFFIDDVFTTGLLPLKLPYKVNYIDFKFDWDGDKTKIDYASDAAAIYYAVMLRENYQYYFQRSFVKLTAEQRQQLPKSFSKICSIKKCRN